MRPSPQPLEQPLAVDAIAPGHAPILETRHLRWPDEPACAAFAAALARKPALHDAFIELRGPLGAGKTAFARHLLRALGVNGRIKSPSYALLEPYGVGGLAISHLDFYRFDDAREMLAMLRGWLDGAPVEGAPARYRKGTSQLDLFA